LPDRHCLDDDRAIRLWSARSDVTWGLWKKILKTAGGCVFDRLIFGFPYLGKELERPACPSFFLQTFSVPDFFSAFFVPAFFPTMAAEILRF